MLLFLEDADLPGGTWPSRLQGLCSFSEWPGGPLGWAPRWSGQQGLQSEEQDAVRGRECLGGKANSAFGVKAHPPRMVGQNLERIWLPLTLHSLCRSGLFHSVLLFFLSFSLL